jgi:hypothetical protein
LLFIYLYAKGIERHLAINVSLLVFDFIQHNTSNIACTNYSASLPNGARLLISLLLFLQITNVSFAGTTTMYASNTLKFTIRIEDWPFATIANSLAVAIAVTGFSSSLVSKCNNVSENGSDEQGSLRWFTIQSGPYTLYGQLLNVGVLDGRIERSLSRGIQPPARFELGCHTFGLMQVGHFYSPFIFLIADIFCRLGPQFQRVIG